jgi:DNA-binding HxlR family transcriptional regulator
MENQTIGSSSLGSGAETGVESDACPSAAAVEQFHAAMRILTGKWKGEILWRLGQGTLRFGELRRSIPGITQHMLTTQLRDLEAHGLVKRTIYPEVPPRVEYELTPSARDLGTVFREIWAWSDRHATSLNLTD